MEKPIPPVITGQFDKKKLLGHLPQFAAKKVLVVGDVGLDEYILGEVRRISPEAPVPVLEVESEDLRLGLAANVALNIKTLGGDPFLISVVGKDTGSELLQKLFSDSGVSTEGLVCDETRPTTRKSRVMAKHHHIVRVDYELRRYLSPDSEKKILERVQSYISSVDIVVLEDYAKGVISQNLVKALVELARKHNKKILADPHRNNNGAFYHGVDLIKPNFEEAMVLSGLTHDELRDHPSRALEVGIRLKQITGAKELVMTRGKDGMTIFTGDKIVQVPTYARQVFDVTGAGDTVISALALGISSGLELSEACMLANFAAGVVVGQIGCVPCTVSDLRDYILSSH